jgi:hypothetical protein
LPSSLPLVPTLWSPIKNLGLPSCSWYLNNWTRVGWMSLVLIMFVFLWNQGTQILLFWVILDDSLHLGKFDPFVYHFKLRALRWNKESQLKRKWAQSKVSEVDQISRVLRFVCVQALPTYIHCFKPNIYNIMFWGEDVM